MKKMIRQLKNSLKIIKNSSIRTNLTFIGILISTALYFSGNVILDSYLYQDFVYYENFPSNALLINSIDENNMDYYVQSLDKYKLNIVQYKKTMIETNHNGDGLECYVESVNENFSTFPRISTDTKNSLEYSTIKYGRYISGADILVGNPVIMIHESYAKLLIDGEPLGKKIEINNIAFLIVGILNDTPDVIRTCKRISNNENVPIRIYTSEKCLNRIDNFYGNVNKSLIGISDDDVLLLSDEMYENEKLFTKNILIKNVKEQHKSFEVLLNFLVILIIFICCLVILVTMIFNIKERIFEFGIRMAVGAQKDEIVFSIMIEALVYSTIGIFFGLILGLFLSLIFSYLLYTACGMFILRINPMKILISLFLPLLFVLGFSLIPAFFTSRKNIIDCLKVE